MKRLLIVILPMSILAIAYLISRRADENSNAIVNIIDNAVDTVDKVVTENLTGGDVGKYFKRKEFACKCGCGFDDVKQTLVNILDEAREHFGAPIYINSGCRCVTHNRNVGGATNSQHVQGTAADIRVSGVNPADVYNYFNNKYPNQYGIGKYSTFTHIDVRSSRARWTG